MDALENDEANTWERPELAVFQYESSLGLLPKTPAAERSTYDIVAEIKRLRPSGERFEYLSVNTFMLGWLVERVTGRSYGDALAERIWSRIGAEADALLVTSPRTGAVASHGGMSGTLRDLARYGLLYTPSWTTVASSRVVPEDYLRKVQKGGRPELLERAAPGSKELGGDGVEPARYPTYQWDAVWADGDFFKYGFRGQGLYVSPARDLVVAFFGTESQSQVRYARALVRSGLFKN
jgi:CubicO group peptidase (beta-lactamase class C family)